MLKTGIESLYMTAVTPAISNMSLSLLLCHSFTHVMDESTALALGLNTTQSKFEFAAIDQKLNVTSELFV
jgi:hypothetical protein